MFGDMFEDEEDYSLSSFSASGARAADGRRTLSRPAEPRPSDGFVGLLNQGATCYLNSLIQALYMTPELRAGLFDLSLADLQVVTTAPAAPVAAEAEAEAAAAAATPASPAEEEPQQEQRTSADAEEEVKVKEVEEVVAEPTKELAATEVQPAAPAATEHANDDATATATDTNTAVAAGAGGAGGGDDADDPRAFLASMGFEAALVARALARFANDTARAVEWLLSGGAEQTDDADADDDDGFGGLSAIASTTVERDTEDAETDLSGFGEQDPFGEGELFEGAADAFATAEDDEDDAEISEERQAREAKERQAEEKAEREEQEWKEREKARQKLQQQEWSCHLCTFLNPPSKSHCGVCETRRQKPQVSADTGTTTEHTETGKPEQASTTNGSNGNGTEEITKNEQGEQVIVKKRKIPMELQRLFARMQAADVDAVSTESLTESFGWQGREMFEQQDVHELNRVLFDAIERSLKNTPACDLISNLYKGVTVNQIVCTNCKNVSEREEAFQDVTLTVAGLGSVTASLAAATEYEMLTGDNRYNCENCGQRVDALKGAVFRSLPPILILSLSRFTYDVERDGRVKVGDKFAFPLLLDLFPFTEQARAEGKAFGGGPSVLTSIALSVAAVSQEKEEKPSPETAQAAASSDADAVGAQEDGAGDHTKPSESQGKRGRKNKNKKGKEDEKAKEEEKEVTYELEQEPVDVASPHLYELFSVIIHCGSSAGFGHYHAYIRDVFHTTTSGASPTRTETTQTAPSEGETADSKEKEKVEIDHPLAERKEDVPIENKPAGKFGDILAEAGRGWYDFNDSTVKPIPVERLATQYAGRSECAYMLVYRHLPPTPAVSGADGNAMVEEATTSGHARTPAPPPIPEHLLPELATYNAELQRERGEYERDRGLIDIMTYHPRHFRILGGQIHKRITNTHSTAVRGAAAASAGKSDAAAADERDRKLLTLSKDTPVSRLVADIKDALGEADAGPVEKLRLDQVELRGTQLTFSGLSLLLSEVQTESTLETIGIKEGSSLSFLLWDGETICGETYDPEAHQINIRVTHYASRVEGQLPAADVDPVISELVVRLGDMETVSELKTRVASLTGIPVDKQYMCRIEYQKFTHLAENNISLVQLGIYNESKVTVELQPTGSERSWAWEMFLRRQKLMEIFVTDKCSGEEPFPTITVEMDKKATLAELKTAVLSKFPAGLMDIALVTQLRRSLPGGGDGTVYADESRTLDEVGVKDGDRVIIEHGDSAQHVPIVGLRFVVSLSGTKERAMPDPIDIDVPRNATIAKCKEMMCAMFDKPADKSRLRQTDIWGGPDRLFDDESRTLDEAKVLPGDLLWLEDGKPPVRGQIEVFFQLYFRRESGASTAAVDSSPPPQATKSQATDNTELQSGTASGVQKSEQELDAEGAKSEAGTGTDERKHKEQEPLRVLRSLVSPAVHLARSFPPALREAKDAPFSVSSLFKLDISRSITVRTLKEQLKATAAFDHVPSADHIRLWHQERLLKHDRWPLKKHHVANYSTITVEILESPETSGEQQELEHTEAAAVDSVRKARGGDGLVGEHEDADDDYEDYDADVGNNALLLYLHRRDPVRRTITFLSTLWFGGDTVAQLRSEVAQVTGIDREHLQLIKYLQYNGKWRVLDDEVAEGAETKQQPASASDATQEGSNERSEDNDDYDDEEEEDEGTEMEELTVDAGASGAQDPSLETNAGKEPVEVQSEQERKEDEREAEAADRECAQEVRRHTELLERSPYHLHEHQPSPLRSNALGRRKIEGKPYYLKDGDVVVVKDRRDERLLPEGTTDDFHESLCLMADRDFGSRGGKKRRERGRKDGDWSRTNQPRGGVTRRAVERGIRIDVEEF